MHYPRLTKCMPDEGRPNPFRFPHKALRFGHCRMLAELGTLDFADEEAAAGLQVRLSQLLDLGQAVAAAQQLALSPLLAAAADGEASMARAELAGADMAGLCTAAAEIRSLMRAVKVATPARRAAAGRTLYRCYALFAAADLARMDAEETALLAALHRAADDASLSAAAAESYRHLAPLHLEGLMRLMLPALATAELKILLVQLKTSLEPRHFEQLFQSMVQPLLASNSSAAA